MAFTEALAPTVQTPKIDETDTQDRLTIGGKTFRSRLVLGMGKCRNAEEINAALEASGGKIVTVALRRIDLDVPARCILSSDSAGSPLEGVVR